MKLEVSEKRDHVMRFRRGLMALTAAVSLGATVLVPQTGAFASSKGSTAGGVARGRLGVLKGVDVAAGIPVGTSVTFAHSFCYLNNEGMQVYNNEPLAVARALGWKVIPSVASGASPGSQSEQITQVRTLLGEGTTFLTINPCDSGGIVPAITAANRAGVPVTLTDTQAASGYQVSVTGDEVQHGAAACQGLIAGLKAQHGGKAVGPVIEIQGSLATSAAQGRTKGFAECMKKNAPGVKILIDATDWSATEGATELKDTLGAHPNATGIFMESDTVFFTGTEQVLKSLGDWKKRGQAGHIAIAGSDGGGAILAAIRAGYADADVVGSKTAYFPISLFFLKKLEEHKLGTVNRASLTALGLTVTTVPGGGLLVEVPGRLATPANANNPSFWGNSTCAVTYKGCPVDVSSVRAALAAAGTYSQLAGKA